MNQKIIERAELMASDKTPLGNYWYTISSNPYHHKLGSARRGSPHIEWHNAFIDECKRIGRSIK